MRTDGKWGGSVELCALLLFTGIDVLTSLHFTWEGTMSSGKTNHVSSYITQVDTMI